MTQIKRNELAELLQRPEVLTACPIFLVCGERYLCREAADQLQAALLADGAGTVHPIDGDQEDSGRTLSRLLTFSLLPGAQIFRVADSRIFHSKTVAGDIWERARQSQETGKNAAAMRHIVSLARLAGLAIESRTPFSELTAGQWQNLFDFSKPEGDLGWADTLFIQAAGTGRLKGTSAASVVDRYIEAFTAGIPHGHHLILTAETVDKRQRLFTFIKKHGMVIDCSVATGASSAAQKEQKEVLREMMAKTLGEFDKTIEPRALELFFDRVGFHPVAVVTECEKLALYVGDRQRITCQDLEEMVGRNREDALFELTDAFGKRDLGRVLAILNRLQDSGVHGLAILATMRNYVRKQLIYRSLQLCSPPAWQRGMNARQFQQSYLPALKQRGQWGDQLGGHPYALYMSFSKAAEFSCARLKKWLKILLEAEYRLKGSPLPPRLVLEDLFLRMLQGEPKVTAIRATTPDSTAAPPRAVAESGTAAH